MAVLEPAIKQGGVMTPIRYGTERYDVCTHGVTRACYDTLKPAIDDMDSRSHAMIFDTVTHAWLSNKFINQFLITEYKKEIDLHMYHIASLKYAINKLSKGA